MGKVRRLRQKFHTSTKSNIAPITAADSEIKPSKVSLLQSKTDLFANVAINIQQLSTFNIPQDEDQQSTKSTASLMIKKKKDKLKLRREQLLKKIDLVNQMKRESKRKLKRKKTKDIVGDLDSLRDALPSLKNLSKTRGPKFPSAPKKKKKCIEKEQKRKRQLLNEVKAFKTVLKNKKYQKSPLEAISKHVQSLVSHM
ncbi:hypothetical protein ABEB36_001884 [Hypothenemus hampei]|uniref:Protein FAM207A n=1 Tax=Hypothenemus hampei TaxID=57062 RepID=A0ABD1FG10_HYPHA